MSSKILKKTKLPRALNRFPKKKKKKQATSCTIDGIRIKERRKNLRTQSL